MAISACRISEDGGVNRPSTSPRIVALAALIDLVLVVTFAAIGRASHEESAFGVGLVSTAWPFVVALAVGWLVTLAFRRPLALWPTGVLVWIITVAGGLGLRVASGDTAAVPFIIVVTLTLAVFLLGWRAVALPLARRASRN